MAKWRLLAGEIESGTIRQAPVAARVAPAVGEVCRSEKERHLTTDAASVFASVIKDHLELKAKNADLDGTMPINRYTSDDPFENHPLFKSEEQARLEETMDGTEPAVELHSAALPCPVKPEPMRRRPRMRPPPTAPLRWKMGSGAAPATSTGATELPISTEGEA